MSSTTDHQAHSSPPREPESEEQRGNRLILPEDGYEWRKYGQKFIRSIGKFRSYFKCQKSNCMAKKRAEWSISEPDNIRIVYEGVHSHGGVASPAESSTSSNNPNQFNLLTQVLRDIHQSSASNTTATTTSQTQIPEDNRQSE